MRRAAPALPVTPGMIRHFAVVTLLATVCLAMFANGENTSALTEAQEAARARSSGVWGTTPIKPGPQKPGKETGARAVNGMNVAASTKLDQGSQYDPDPEIPRIESEAMGDIRNLDPDLRSLPPGSVGRGPEIGPGQAGVPGVPAPILRDPSGIPIPGLKAGAGQAVKARPQAPRQASEEEVARMLEASRARSSKGNGSTSSYSETDEDE